MKPIHTLCYAGFINIDCGWQNSPSYVDNTLAIPFTSDEEFVQGGLNHDILPEFMAGVGNGQQKKSEELP
jgi:hypothetical protein